MGQRYHKMEDHEPWPDLTRSKNFAKAESLKLKLKSENV